MFGEGELALRHRHACARILHALCTQAKIKIETIKIDGIMNLFLNSCVYICLDFFSFTVIPGKNREKICLFFQGPTFGFGQDELDVPDRHLKNLTVQFWPEILYWILSRTVTSHQKVHF